MIKIEKTRISGIEEAIRGMRNPMNSWDKSDSAPIHIEDPESGNTASFDMLLGDNDKQLMLRLNAAGTSHSKYRRMIVLWCDITAPLYWWKEFDTYKVGTVANSCSTMHKLASRDLGIFDFSYEHLIKDRPIEKRSFSSLSALKVIIDIINQYRKEYVETGDKEAWWQMIQLLPSSYNQTRTIKMNYEVLSKIYKERKGHKLDEWNDLCKWIETLEYSELIIGPKVDPDGNEIEEKDQED